MGFLAGKRFLIVGIASDRSIATGIAEAMHREGAELAFTYQNDKLKSRVVKAAERYGGASTRGGGAGCRERRKPGEIVGRSSPRGPPCLTRSR